MTIEHWQCFGQILLYLELPVYGHQNIHHRRGSCFPALNERKRLSDPRLPLWKQNRETKTRQTSGLFPEIQRIGSSSIELAANFCCKGFLGFSYDS